MKPAWVEMEVVLANMEDSVNMEPARVEMLIRSISALMGSMI